MIGIRRKRSSVRSWRMSTMSTILSLLFFLSFPPLGKWPLFVRKQCWLLLLHSVENQWNFSTFLFFFFSSNQITNAFFCKSLISRKNHGKKFWEQCFELLSTVYWCVLLLCPRFSVKLFCKEHKLWSYTFGLVLY